MTARCRVADCPWSVTYPDETAALDGLESHYRTNHERGAD